MKRTTAEANDSNLYTEGNPSLGVPATVVGAEEMNQIQEEICNAIELAGITLNVADDEQLYQAIVSLIQDGGAGSEITIANNTVNGNVTGLLFDKVDIKGARILFDLFRRSSTTNANEIGELFVSHDTESDTWNVYLASHGADAGVTFSITSGGQVQYTSSNYSGTSYSGTLRFTSITLLKQ